MSGLGGRTQMLIRTPDGSFVGFDGGTEVPRAVPEINDVDESDGGYATIGIPGTVSALVTAARLHGTMPVSQLIQPAIRLAEKGFHLSASEAGRIADVATQLSAFAGSRLHFLKPDGTQYSPGEIFVQPDLARVLRAIAE
jgi:gamma-glutamyltranspeptidase/glutathione hydrolase